MTELPEDKLPHELEERLRFEKLLTEISTRYINMPVDRIDVGIEDDQRRICECLGLDLSALWQWTDNSPRFLTLTHLHSPPEGPAHPVGIDAQESFPWQLQKMLEGETLAFNTEDMPPEAARDIESLRHYGVKSSVVIPLSTGGGPLIGVLSFDTLREERDWPDELVNRLQLVAQIFSSALARKEADRMLRESEARLSLAADSAEAGMWELDCGTNQFWTTERAREIFGYDDEQNIDMKRFAQSVLPEDFPMVQQAIIKSLEEKEPISVEYRITASKGKMKWIHSSGRPYFKPDGKPDRLLGISIDITERKASEYEYSRDQERLASAFDIAELGSYEMGENYRLSFLDNRMREFLGVPPEEEKNGREFWLAHIHPEDLPRVIEVSKKVLEEGVDRFAVEYRYIHPEGRILWFNHLSRVLKRDAGGRATRVIGTLQDITQRNNMEEKLREKEASLRDSQKDLRRLAGKLISAKEDELRRLSRELHDDLTQRLALLAIEAGKLELRLTREVSEPETIQSVSQIKEQLIKVSEDVHRISRQLHPTILDDLGIIRAVEAECTALSRREGIKIIFTHEDMPDRLPADVPLCLYRIVQEGLHNCINHSRTDACKVVLKGSDDTIFLTVEDNGMGFDPADVRDKPGLGLSSMRERVQLVGGNFKVDSQPGRGTSVRVNIPLTRTAK